MRRLFMMIATASLCIAAALSSYATPTAFWTGGGDRSNVNDPANWAVTNSLGEAVANAVPDADTAVVVSGETDFNCPLGQTLTCKSFTVGDCKLTADCDWRGLVMQPSSPAYIDVPNGAYIDTGFKPNQNTRVVMDVTVQDTREYWCGVWDTKDWHNRAFAFGNDDKGVYTAFVKTGKDNNGTPEGNVVANGRHVLDFDKGVFKVDGATHTSRSAGGEVYQWIYPLYLFAQNRTGSAFVHGDQGTIRFHSCQIYDNGTLVRDYVPTNTGTAFGIYDKVNGTVSVSANPSVPLNGSSGIEINGAVDLDGHSLTLADTVGSGMVTDTSGYIDVPAGYYFNTGFKPNQDTRVVMDVTVQGTKEYWCGVWDTTEWSDRAFSFCNDNTGVYTAFVKKGKGYNGTSEGNVVANGRHVLDFDKGVFKVDGATHTSRSAGGEVYQWIYPLYLFAQNRTGSAFVQGDQGTIRFHSCQIYSGETLVHDYIPAKNGTTFGLYDKVGGAFAALAGSGAGLVGGVVAAGELHIDAYGIIENTTLAIDGTLTLIKEGTGTFTATKAGQSYTGGTVVNSGWAKCGVADRPWGVALSLVTIHDGATFDWAGAFTQTGSAYDFAIEGSGTDGNGALVSTGVKNSWDVSTIANLELLGNARIGGCGGWGFANVNGSWPGHTLTMNGHTLSISLKGNGTYNTGTFAFGGVTTSGSGTIAFVDAMSSRVFPSFFKLANDLSSVTLDLGEGYSINVETTTTVGTFIDRMNSEPEDLAKKSPITVVDTFKPKATKLVRTVILGDATHLSPVLDLSELDAPFDLPSSGYTMDVASGAKVQIKLGDRSKTSKTPIITWTGVKPSWINNLKFTRGDNGKNYSIVVKEDGIYVVIGMTITIR